MNEPLSTLERSTLHTVTESLAHQVQAPESSPDVVRDVVRLILVLGTETRQSGITDLEFRSYLISKVRRTLVALGLPRFEELFHTAKKFVLIQHHMDR